MLSSGKLRRNSCRSASFIQIQIFIFTCVMASVFMVGCSPDTDHKAPNLAGTFSGILPDGKHMTITLQQDDNIVSGHGEVDSKSFSVSGVTTIHGPLVVAFENGHVETSNVVLSSRGRTAHVDWLGKKIALQRGGEPIESSSGDFTGKFSTNRPYPIQISITQKEKVLAGTGYITDKAVAVVGIVESGSMCANGRILYSDGSNASTKACLSSDKESLILNEGDVSGTPITLNRSSE
jgi:hypothetical protein